MIVKFPGKRENRRGQEEEQDEEARRTRLRDIYHNSGGKKGDSQRGI
jgi:hypothetical protein